MTEDKTNMLEMGRLIYDFREHGLYYEKKIDEFVEQVMTLAINTIQLEFDYATGELLSICGYCPLLYSHRKSLDIPLYTESKYFMKMDGIEYIPGIAYDYFNFFPESEPDFIKGNITITAYDEKNKRLLIGNEKSLMNKNVKINKNMICAMNESGNLGALLLILDEMIKES